MSEIENLKKDLVITIEGRRYKIKNLDFSFSKFVEESLEEFEVSSNKDNRAEKILYAYLHLAKKYYSCEQEIEDLIKSIQLWFCSSFNKI